MNPNQQYGYGYQHPPPGYYPPQTAQNGPPPPYYGNPYYPPPPPAYHPNHQVPGYPPPPQREVHHVVYTQQPLGAPGTVLVTRPNCWKCGGTGIKRNGRYCRRCYGGPPRGRCFMGARMRGIRRGFW